MISKEEIESILEYELGLLELMTFDTKSPGKIKHNVELSKIIMEKYEEEFCELDRKQFMALCKLYIKKHNLNDAYCKVCGKLCNPKSDYSFHETCSRECGRVIAARKTSETYSKKSEEEVRIIKEKRAITNLKKFGSTTNLQSKEMIDKRIEKYGGNSNFCSKEVQEKIKRTNLEKYGVENVFASDVIKKKIKETNLDRYGKENPVQVKEIKEKIAQTNLKRYGGTLMGSNLLKERIQKSNLEKYGTVYPQKLQTTKDKVKQTNLERSGYEAPMKNPETKEKSIKTCIEKYGVAYNCLRPECKEASGHIISKLNLDWKEKLEETGAIVEVEKIVEGRNAFDLYLPESNTLIDINPTITHQSSLTIPTHFGNIPPKNPSAHTIKQRLAEDNGYKCVMIWDWDDEKKILDFLKPRKALYARKCDVCPLYEQEEIDNFLKDNHFQGTCKGQKVVLALKYNGEVVEIMTFGTPRYNKKYKWELLRLCTKIGYTVIGGSEKLFKAFTELYNPESIISYCDRSKFSGDIYNRLGFKLKGKLQPSKHWYNPATKRHITNSLLLQRGFSQLHGDHHYELANKGESNTELMLNAGYLEVYDCGQATYIWYAD